MNQDVPQEEHEELIELVASKHIERKQMLIDAEALVERLPKHIGGEASHLVGRLKKGVLYYEKVLDLLKKNFSQESDCNKSQYEADDEDNDLVFDESEELVRNESNQRDPMDMLQPDYKEMTLFEIIERILNDNPKELSREEVTRIAYDTRSEDEFERAKASISAQLRIGANKGKWVKTERGVFAANHVAQELQTSDNKSPSINTDTSPMADPLLVLSQIQNGRKID